jgi:hypothetical protein
MTENRKKLSDILTAGQRKSYFANWDTVKAAGDFIVAKGEYVALLIDGYAFTANTGTKGYKLAFEIAEGEHTGRKVFHELWLTEAAKPQTKRDLDALGIKDPERQLEGPVPQGIVVALTVVVRKDDDGIEQNRIRRIKFMRIAPCDPFAPQDTNGASTPFFAPPLDPPQETARNNGASLPLQPRIPGPERTEGEKR